MVLGLRIEREAFVSNSHRPQLLDLNPIWCYMEKERERAKKKTTRCGKYKKKGGEEFDRGLGNEMSG